MIRDFVDHIFLINLDERTDRLKNVEEEIRKIGIKHERFSAIKPSIEELDSSEYNLSSRDKKKIDEKYIIGFCGIKRSQIEIIKKEKRIN